MKYEILNACILSVNVILVILIGLSIDQHI